MLAFPGMVATRILVVEDEPDIAEVLQFNLETRRLRGRPSNGAATARSRRSAGSRPTSSSST